MSEQLSIVFSEPVDETISQENEGGVIEEVVYEALDYQLAKLLQKLNGQDSSTLEKCILEISKHTREGQIFISCSPDQESELLNNTANNVIGKAGDYKPLILENGYLYLNRYFSYQQQLAENISARTKPTKKDDSTTEWLTERLDFYFNNGNSNGNEGEGEGEINWQKLASEQALKQSFLILSGGPGTGKTTTISRILALLIEQHLRQEPKSSSNKFRILLAAPTGKAAIRMLDSLHDAQQKMNLNENIVKLMPTQASTLHKLLGYQPNTVQFKHNRNHPLNADVVLVDEASMIDIALMSKLVEAVPTQAKLILIGDKDQLSSVETGSVFADICEGLEASQNKNRSIVTLQKNWRFSTDSGIGQLAIATNQSDSQQLLKILHDDEKKDCQLLSPSIIEKNQIPNSLIEPWGNYFKALNNPQSSIAEIFEAFNEYRILCALRRGLNGSTIMSERIESAIVKQGFLHTHSQQELNKSWYHGRPVMITQNSYSKSLFNGDTGIALIEDQQVKVYFPDGSDGAYKSFAPVRLPTHETTWAMTIHKSQGSEFNEVALILPHEVMPLLTKQLIYTGITRAKERISIVASESIINAGLKTEVVKATNIAEALRLDS